MNLRPSKQFSTACRLAALMLLAMATGTTLGLLLLTVAQQFPLSVLAAVATVSAAVFIYGATVPPRKD